MGKFSGILICSDFDGTLASGKEISEENINAIKYFQSEGGLFTVSTGRYPLYVTEFKDKFVPNTYLICLNGTFICDAEFNPIYENRISVSDARELYSFIKQNCDDLEHIFAYGTDGTHKNEQPAFEPYKMIAVTESPEGCLKFKKIISEYFGDKYFISRSWPTGLEIINSNAGKDVCVKYLKERTNSKTLICMGDFENDTEMLKAADIGIAVENALPCVKAVADKVTENNYTSAVAEVIGGLLKE